jgi:hypothetical protein
MILDQFGIDFGCRFWLLLDSLFGSLSKKASCCQPTAASCQLPAALPATPPATSHQSTRETKFLRHQPLGRGSPDFSQKKANFSQLQWGKNRFILKHFYHG